LPGYRVYVQLPTQQLGPLGQIAQPHAAAIGLARHRKTTAVIGNAHFKLMSVAAQGDGDMRGVGMFQGVVQGFNGDGVQLVIPVFGPGGVFINR
jgi:hypothetical protein